MNKKLGFGFVAIQEKRNGYFLELNLQER